MNCKQANRLLSQYSDGDLRAPLHAQMQAHLAACPACTDDLHALQQAVVRLQTDALAAVPDTTDLYVAFRERLVMHPSRVVVQRRRRLQIGLLAGLAVPALGASCIGYSLWQKYPSTILSGVANRLREQESGPVFISTVTQMDSSNALHSDATSYMWGSRGYQYNLRSVRNNVPIAVDTAHPTLIIAPGEEKQEVSEYWATPGGVVLSWQQNALPRTSSYPVQLAWHSCDPEHSFRSEVDGWCSTILASQIQQFANSGQATRANVEQGTETCMGETYSKITIRNLQSSVEQPKDDVPVELILWFDAQNHLRHLWEQYQNPNGLTRTTAVHIQNMQNPPPTVFVPSLPAHRPVVLSPQIELHRVPQDSPIKSLPRLSTPHAEVVKPSWLTMSDTERQEVTAAIGQFATALETRDIGELRGIVDTDWPLEITHPERRIGLTSADVWQQTWLNRLQHEPSWQTYHISFDFAYQADKRLLDAVPLDMSQWQWERTSALPGLNVLAWVTAYPKGGGKVEAYGARIFLVKRPNGWKVFQFARMPK